MKTRDILNYGLFLLITFGTFFLCVENNLESRHDILYFSTGLYFAIRLIKSFINLKEGKRLEFGLNILIAFVILQISLKAYYFYYNRFFAYSLLFASVLYILFTSTEKTVGSFKTTKNYLLFIVVVTAITISIPDNVFLFYTNPSVKHWTPNVQWTDFKGRKNDPLDSIAASMNSGLRWKDNRVFDYPPAIVVSQMSPQDSKINDYWEVTEDDHQLLMHEQGHFNIKEFHARLIMDSLRNHWTLDKRDIDRIVYHFFRKANKADSLYDQETQHGKHDLMQRKWTEEYLKKLKLK